mmetsp:Transcript_90424/g.206835  ORF Transcript_90424/g.206835 Transcript_90424/m.206835 type:complete len:251 (-) Transcript_90424:2528-3280(-)
MPQGRHSWDADFLHRYLVHVAEGRVAQLQVSQQKRSQQHKLRRGPHQALALVGNAVHLHSGAVGTLGGGEHGRQGKGDLSATTGHRIPADADILHLLRSRRLGAVPPRLHVEQRGPNLHDQLRPWVLVLDVRVVRREHQGHHGPVEPGLPGENCGEDEEIRGALGLVLEGQCCVGVVYTALDGVAEHRRLVEGQSPLQHPRQVIEGEHDGLRAIVQLPHEVPHSHCGRQVLLEGGGIADNQSDELIQLVR